MFFPEGQIRVFLYGQPADMRRSFDGLQALTRHAMGQDPLICGEQQYESALAKNISLSAGDRVLPPHNI